MISHDEVFPGIEHQLQENILLNFFHYSCLWNWGVFVLNWEASSTHLKLNVGSFCDIAHPYKLFTSQ